MENSISTCYCTTLDGKRRIFVLYKMAAVEFKKIAEKDYNFASSKVA